MILLNFYHNIFRTIMKTIMFPQQSRVLLALVLAALAAVMLFAGCENFNGPLPGTTKPIVKDTTMTGTKCDTLNVSYSKTVQPILQSNCVPCHSGPGATAGVDMSSLTSINRQVGRNRLFPNVLTGRNGASQMPQGGRLSQCEIDQITAWVNQGTKNN
jgi:hypothetical protein